MAALRDFLCSGHLGPLAIGVKRDDLRASLGEPDDTTPPRRKPVIGKYGNVQLAFEGDVVSFIGIYLDRGGDVPAFARLEDQAVSRQTTAEEFRRCLESEGIPFSVDERLTFPGQYTLSAGIGVSVVFDGDEQHLASLQLA